MSWFQLYESAILVLYMGFICFILYRGKNSPNLVVEVICFEMHLSAGSVEYKVEKTFRHS